MPRLVAQKMKEKKSVHGICAFDFNIWNGIEKRRKKNKMEKLAYKNFLQIWRQKKTTTSKQNKILVNSYFNLLIVCQSYG